MATFAALGFLYADVLRQPYAQLTPTCKTLRLTICVQVLQKQRKMPSENLWGGPRPVFAYANLTPAHVFERAVSGHGFTYDLHRIC